MRKLELAEIKAVELDILMNFDAFCKEIGIRYYLSNGTLLGAVKYNGFIPWDDDIDVLMPRLDYDKLIALYQDTERYRLYSMERHNTYAFPFAKLCDMHTRKEETNINNGTQLGIDIDIFPLDAWANKPSRQNRELRYISLLMSLLGISKMKKVVASTNAKRLILALVMMMGKLFRSRSFCKLIEMVAKRKPQQPAYIGCKVWPIYGCREIISASVFAETVDVSFEGKMYPAPKGYDAYLKKLYGEYANDPPIEKQRTHHSFAGYMV